MEITIIRHAQSSNNALMEDQHLRVKDPLLTPLGVQQAQRVADWLAQADNLEDMMLLGVDSDERLNNTFRHHITHLYCSPMIRALQTAQPIGQRLGLQPEVWIDIHEHGGIFLKQDGSVQGFGGMTRAEMAAQFPDARLPDAITEQGWWDPARGLEDLSDMHARAIRTARALRLRAATPAGRQDSIALVSHGMFIDSLLKALLHTLPSDRFFFWHYNTALTRLDINDDDSVSVRYSNRVTHLPPEMVT